MGHLSDWFRLVFNLRQWYKIGDLGASYCNTLSLNFESDGISNTGFGARVDDLYVYYGDTVGSYECGIIADPQSGDAPLTVAFRATTDIYDPDFIGSSAMGILRRNVIRPSCFRRPVRTVPGARV